MSFNLIISGGHSGSFNMSADIFLLNRYKTADAFSANPTLRIYYFNPPALSLGFFQKDKNIDDKIIEKAKNNGFDIVSRPTGGRAVLHKSEITYSVTASYKNGIFAGKLIETYKKISEFLYLFFIKLGLKPDNVNYPNINIFRDKNKENKENNKNGRNNFNCFLKAHSYEITFGGKKICGNSQRRNDFAFLQHGSIYIDYKPEEHIEIFGGSGGDYNAYFNNITGILREINKNKELNNLHKQTAEELTFDYLSEILALSFSEAYNLEPVILQENILE
jgi:lipoate-protein ligase A